MSPCKIILYESILLSLNLSRLPFKPSLKRATGLSLVQPLLTPRTPTRKVEDTSRAVTKPRLRRLETRYQPKVPNNREPRRQTRYAKGAPRYAASERGKQRAAAPLAQGHGSRKALALHRSDAHSAWHRSGVR